MKNDLFIWHKLTLPKTWPILEEHVLYQLALKTDRIYPFLTKNQKNAAIEEAIKFGTSVAKEIKKLNTPLELFNLILKHKVRIIKDTQKPKDQTMPKKTTKTAINKLDYIYPENIQATYLSKPPTIIIHQPHIDLLKQFFSYDPVPPNEKEITSLYICNAFFYHLTKKSYKKHSTQIIIKNLGLLKYKKYLTKPHDIASYIFTKNVLKLKWNPMIIDHLITLRQCGWSNEKISIYFQSLNQKHKTAIII